MFKFLIGIMMALAGGWCLVKAEQPQNLAHKVYATLLKNTFQVREDCSVEMSITSNIDLASGAKIEVLLPNSWLVLNGPSFTREIQAKSPQLPHFVEFKGSNDNIVFEISIIPCNQLYEQGAARHGRKITAILKRGIVKAGEKIIFRYSNTFAPYIAENTIMQVKVNEVAAEREVQLITLPGPAADVRIIVPSGVKPGREFPIHIVSLDKFDNCSSSEFKNKVLYDDKGSVVAENLNFAGSTIVTFKILKEGVFRFTMDGVNSNALIISESGIFPYWGDIHIHTKLSHDGQGENPYQYARYVSGLDFAAASDHWQSLGDPGYELLKTWAEAAYDPGNFVTIPADERNPAQWNGHHNIYFRDIEYFMKNKVHPVGRAFVPAEPWSEFDEKRTMIIPHHTGICFSSLPRDKKNLGSSVDLSLCDSMHLIPVMEIYSHHGQSETYAPQHILSYEFNRMRNSERRANTSMSGPYYAQSYWMAGMKLGVIASSDGHTGQGGRRHGGIAAVYADKLTRESIFDAIKARHSYGTTGERILVDFKVNGSQMGEITKVPSGSTIEISLKVWGTARLLRVEILRFRFGLDSAFSPVLSEAPRPETTDAEYKLTEIASSNCVYYARITQYPVEWPGMAWTSPVWIECEKR
ncbi:MAG: DUF3604 domain-containing protein [Lentisphaerota bacterium]